MEPTSGLPADRLPLACQQLVARIDDQALILLDQRGLVASWNAGAERIKGWSAAEILGEHFRTFYPPEAVAVGHPERELEIASVTGRHTEEGWRVRKDGTRFWARVQIVALTDDAGAPLGFGKVTHDLTAERQKEEQITNVLALLERSIRIDSLTGLPNRRAWDERIAEEMSRSAREGTPLTVALFDLDRFKDYNDTHGHLAGDELLKQAGVLWRQAIRPHDVLARHGGEEFVMALPCTLDEARVVADRVRTATPLGQTCSVGLALWDGEEAADRLLDRADRAMYAAKAAGRDRVHLA